LPQGCFALQPELVEPMGFNAQESPIHTVAAKSPRSRVLVAIHHRKSYALRQMDCQRRRGLAH
jgi:hypothetical protein